MVVGTWSGYLDSAATSRCDVYDSSAGCHSLYLKVKIKIIARNMMPRNIADNNVMPTNIITNTKNIVSGQ